MIVPETPEGYIYSINSENDFLYYTVNSNGESAGIYRIRKDASGKQKLKDCHARYLTISAGLIYFDQEGKFYRMKTDGSELTVCP